MIRRARSRKLFCVESDFLFVMLEHWKDGEMKTLKKTGGYKFLHSKFNGLCSRHILIKNPIFGTYLAIKCWYRLCLRQYRSILRLEKRKRFQKEWKLCTWNSFPFSTPKGDLKSRFHASFSPNHAQKLPEIHVHDKLTQSRLMPDWFITQ